MFIKRSLIAVSVLIVSVGCAKLDDDYQVNPILTSQGSNGGPVLIKEGDQRPVIRPFNLDNGVVPGAGGCRLEMAHTDKICRNTLQEYLLGLSDQACNIHRGEILSTAAKIDLGFSGATTLLGGAGALVAGDASRVLAGLAGATSGIHSNVRSSVYQNQLVGAILRKIKEQRQTASTAIKARQGDELDAYNAQAMLRDVVAYHDLCAFYSGLSALVNSDATLESAEQLRGRITSIKRDIADNDALIAALKTNGMSPSDKRIKNLEEAIDASSQSLKLLNIRLTAAEAAGASQTPSK